MTGSSPPPPEPVDQPVDHPNEKPAEQPVDQPAEQPVEAEIVAPVVPRPEPAAADYDERGVPSFDYVRDRIESRYATSLGATELAEETAQARTVEEQQAERERAAKAKLEEIRRKLRG